jgi:hypothetical protein
LAVSDVGSNRVLHEAEIRVMDSCAQAPRGRYDFSGIDRMVLQILQSRGWLERIEQDGLALFRPTPSGLVALGVARLTAAE